MPAIELLASSIEFALKFVKVTFSTIAMSSSYSKGRLFINRFAQPLIKGKMSAPTSLMFDCTIKIICLQRF
jgi:hypothetical protein